MKKILTVNHFAQYLDTEDPEWQERTCPITCLVMVMDYFGREISVDEALKKAFEIKVTDPQLGEVGPHDPKFGWRHDAIVKLAESYGFEAERTEKDTVENLIHSLSENRPVLVNIFKNFDPAEGGHFVVLNGVYTDDNAGEIVSFFINDPIGGPHKYKNKGIPYDVFMQGWKKRSIYVSEQAGTIES